MTKKYRATIAGWEGITGIKVIDPDGFNRKDPRLMERLFTYAEFRQGLQMSTISMPAIDLVTPKTPQGLLPFTFSTETKPSIVEGQL